MLHYCFTVTVVHALLSAAWALAACPSADISGDCLVDLNDFALMAEQWLTTDPCAPEGMVYIPGGNFFMGDHYGVGQFDEVPLHWVYVDQFFMGRHEVSNQQYVAYLNDTLNQGLIEVRGEVVYPVGGSEPYCDTYDYDWDSSILFTGEVFAIRTGRENHPVVQVSWFGAAAYANWLSGQHGLQNSYDQSTWDCNFLADGYRLATEAEWEFAARAGHHEPYQLYPWGTNDIDCSMANHHNGTTNCNPHGLTDFPYTNTVGYYAPDAYGLYDMAGNVWEWCNDWYASDYYASSPYNNPTGPVGGYSTRVIRSGAWYHNADYARAASRAYHIPGDRWGTVGLRLVRSAP